LVIKHALAKHAIALMLLIGIGLIFPAAAQDAPAWSAWLYDPISGQVTQVAPDGTALAEFPLPLEQAYNTYPAQIAVSPSGSHIAYVASDTLTGGTSRALFVYNVSLSSSVANVPLSPLAEASTIDLAATSRIFDEASQRVAFGAVLLDRNDPEAEADFTLFVLNYGTNTVEATLTGSELEIADRLAVPVITAFDGDSVTFLAVNYAAGGAAEYAAYTWALADNTVEPNPVYQSLALDTLPATGEVIQALIDDRLPAAEQTELFGPLPVINTLQVYDPAAGTIFPFYNETVGTLLGAWFVQNGERVLALTFNPESQANEFTLLERDGSVVSGLDVSGSVFRLLGTPDGFVYIDTSRAASGVLISVPTRDGTFAEAVLYEAPEGTYPSLIHVSSSVPAPESYTPWIPLAEAETVE
jgi:hypothetical protein